MASDDEAQLLPGVSLPWWNLSIVVVGVVVKSNAAKLTAKRPSALSRDKQRPVTSVSARCKESPAAISEA